MLDEGHIFKKEPRITPNSERLPYTIYLLKAEEIEGCNFDCLVLVPNEINNPTRIALTCRNTGSPDSTYQEKSGIRLRMDAFLAFYQNVAKQKDILVYPYLTQIPDGAYYQQLTREAILDKTPGYERVDNQIASAIESIKEKLIIEDQIPTEDKIDVLGFSSSGTFAQRFTALHYEMVRACYSMGAKDGIILPVRELEGERLNYPNGVADYEEITGKEFNLEEYKKVCFYTGYGKEVEEPYIHNGQIVRDENGNIVSNFDMSYVESCTPPEEGAQMRRVIGRTPEERFRRYEAIYKELGFDYTTEVFPDIGHMQTPETTKSAQDFFRKVTEKELSIQEKSMKKGGLNDCMQDDRVRLSTEQDATKAVREAALGKELNETEEQR